MNKVTKHIRTLALAALTGVVLTACTTVEKGLATVVPFYDYDYTELDSLVVTADADSNRDLPVAIDLVFIFDENVGKELKALSGPIWFAQKQSMLLKYQKVVMVQHLEVVPFTVYDRIELPDGYEKAYKVYLFANYLAKKGQFMADITEYDDLLLRLHRDSYELEELDK